MTVGQEITAKIVDLNEADKKISLSMKALEPVAEPVEEAAEVEAVEETAEVVEVEETVEVAEVEENTEAAEETAE